MLPFLLDCRHALRQLRIWPGLAFTVIITLALGIGANTAIFSVMDAVLLRTLPVREPQQLFYVAHANMPADVSATGDSRFTFGINVYNHLRADNSAFSDVIAYAPLSLSKTAVRYGSTPEEAEADEVSGNFFSSLGVQMAAGEPFTATDESKHSQVAVLSYRYWTQRFNREQGVIGKTLYVEGVPFTILGVAKQHFYGIESGGEATNIWIPLQSRSDIPAWGTPANSDTLYGSPNWWSLMLMVRLVPGVTPEQATDRANPVFIRAAYETAGRPQAGVPKLALTLVPAKGLGTASIHYREPMHVLIIMVGVVLLIACINVALLLVMRGSARQREFAVRLALGANRWSLFRQLFLEGAVMVMIGSTLGWLFAVEATRLLGLWAGLDVSLAPNSTVLFFAFAISALTAILFGLAPLRTATSAPLGLVLKSGAVQATASKGKVRAGKIVVAAQMSLCVPLLFGSGLLVHTLRNYENVDLGMQADQVLVFGLHPMGAQPKANNLFFYRLVIERLSELPGVAGVTLAENRPGSEWSDNNDLIIDGRDYTSNKDGNVLRSNMVGPHFFKTLGIPLLAGRDISETDTESAPAVAVVNRTLVQQYLKNTNPIGHTLGDPKHPVTIVGVARDSKYTEADEQPMPMAWYSYQQTDAIGDMDVEVRAATNPLAMVRAVRGVMRGINPNIPLEDPELLKAQFAQSYAMPVLFARLAVFFGSLAVLLVATGLYGVLAYRVRLRTFEIGVRIALGATRQQILWMVLRESLLLAAIGLVVGLPLTLFASKLMASMLYDLSTHDPVSLAVAAVAVLSIALVASLVPAYRAGAVEPTKALRAE